MSILVAGVLLAISFLAASGEDEGTLGTNKLWIFFAHLFYIFRFPTHTLFWKLFSENGPLIFLIGLLINCCFYGLIIERIIHLFKKKKED